ELETATTTPGTYATPNAMADAQRSFRFGVFISTWSSSGTGAVWSSGRTGWEPGLGDGSVACAVAPDGATGVDGWFCADARPTNSVMAAMETRGIRMTRRSSSVLPSFDNPPQGMRSWPDPGKMRDVRGSGRSRIGRGVHLIKRPLA